MMKEAGGGSVSVASERSEGWSRLWSVEGMDEWTAPRRVGMWEERPLDLTWSWGQAY